MKKWSDDDKNLVKECTLAGWSIEDIAAEMDISRNEVKYLRRHAGVSSKNSYKDLYKGTDNEIRDRLIKVMQEAPIVSYMYFNSKESNTPAATMYRKYFGSWEAALLAAGVANICTLKKDKPTILYLVHFLEGFYKIGITQQTVHQRLGGRYPKYDIVLQHHLSLEEAQKLEKLWLNNVKDFKYIPDNFPSEGRGFTECFKV